MREIKTSKLLSKLIEEAKAIGNKRNPPFTAERFIVAIINKISLCVEDIAGQNVHAEWQILSGTIQDSIKDIDAAKESLMQYICQDKSTTFLDDLYMKNKMQKALELSVKAELEEIDAIVLYYCIVLDPSDAIKPILVKISTEKEDAENKDDANFATALDAKIDEPLEGIDTPASEDGVGNKTTDNNGVADSKNKTVFQTVKLEMSELVTDVKRIRAELQSCVYGQDNAINVFATSYFQASMLSMIDKSRKRPRATFLFAGPHGVGKRPSWLKRLLKPSNCLS